MDNQPKNYSEKSNKFSGDSVQELDGWEGADGCLATDKITVDGSKVGYMYRDEPDNDIDSGWRFLEGSEDDEYMENAGNVGVYKLNTICKYDHDIIPYLKSPVGSAYSRADGGGFEKDEDDEDDEGDKDKENKENSGNDQ